MGKHRLRALESEIDRVAVRRGFRDVIGREHAVGAGAVLDHDVSPPVALCTLFAKVRLTMSETPPAWVGTMMRIGWVG